MKGKNCRLNIFKKEEKRNPYSSTYTAALFGNADKLTYIAYVTDL